MKRKIVIVGAGSACFTRGLIADLIAGGRELELGLVDIDPEAMEVALRLARRMVETARAPITVKASTGRRDLLADADAVITTISVGGRRAWLRDVLVPREHGILQPVGDSVMPGGTSRALRMIPPMVAIARDVRELAPRALFFNYANPMGPVCRAVDRAVGAGMVGLCHGVYHVAAYLAQALGVQREELGYNAVGMNHLTWFTSLRVRGEDAMPRLRAMARARARAPAAGGELGKHFQEAGSGQVPVEDNPFSWWLLHVFGAFPAVLDRHVTEFFTQFFRDGNYYGQVLGQSAYNIESVIAHGDRAFEQMREYAFSSEPLPAEWFDHGGGEHEQVVEIIDSVWTDAGRVYSANLPNRGQVPNLPRGAIVEAPAVADGDGLRPLTQEPLAAGIAGTLATRMQWVETVVEAALAGSRAKLVQALVLDGAVASPVAAERLAADLLAAQAEHLPQFQEPAPDGRAREEV